MENPDRVKREENIATLLLLLLAATLAQNRWEDRAIAAPFRLLGGGEARSVSRFIAERLVNKSGDLFFPRLASERITESELENRDIDRIADY